MKIKGKLYFRLVQLMLVVVGIVGYYIFFVYIFPETYPELGYFYNADATLVAHYTEKFSGFEMNYPSLWELTEFTNKTTHEKDYKVCKSGRCLEILTYAPTITPAADPLITTYVYGNRSIHANEIELVDTKTGDIIADQFTILNPKNGKYRIFNIIGTNINDSPDYRGFLISMLGNLFFIKV